MPFHPNALTLIAHLRDEKKIEETYYSVGGGFVVKEGEKGSGSGQRVKLKFPIDKRKNYWRIAMSKTCRFPDS